MALQKHNSDNIESIEVYLTATKTPIAFAKKKAELIDSGMSEDEAIKFINETPFEMEIYYSDNCGLFMVESEAVTDCEITDPYTGEQLEENEELF